MASIIIVKKIVGNYGNNLSVTSKLEKLSLAMNKIQEEKDKKFEVHVKLVIDAKEFDSDSAERNLFMAISNALKKITSHVM